MRSVVQFGGQFNTGCPGPDDSDADLLNGIVSPTVAARQAATLDRLSGGRALFNLVTGVTRTNWPVMACS